MNKKKGMAIASLVLGVCSAGALIGNYVFDVLIPITESFNTQQLLGYFSGTMALAIFSSTAGMILGAFACNSSEKKWKAIAIVGLVISTITSLVMGAMSMRGLFI